MRCQTYHIGLLKKSEDTVVVQMVTNKDLLSCELFEYLGTVETTKEQVKRLARAGDLLKIINAEFNSNFRKIKIM